jgi:hypothetical protein
MSTLVMTNPSRTGEALEAALEPYELPFKINWTGAVAEHPEFEVLNEKSRTNKMAQLIQLELKGVSVVPWTCFSHYRGGGRWLGRSNNHQQGRDFTGELDQPDFWTKYIPADDEWRLHFFRTAKGNMRLLRSGIKLPKQRNFHPWVRSHRLGWKISYVGGAPQSVVSEARKAMLALDLDFGAVDVLFQDGKVWVLEVNTCPGLDSGTLGMYVDCFIERGEREW